MKTAIFKYRLEKCPKINKRAGPNKIVQGGSWTKIK